MHMRDIRKDLEERLKSIASDRASLQAKVDQLLQAEQGVKALLRQEDERFAKLSPPLFPMDKEAGSGNAGGVRQVIVTALRQKKRPLDKDELKLLVKEMDFSFGEKSPGRVIHFALIGLKESGVVDHLKDGRWELKRDKQEAMPN
jgi:hypothetical protein